MSLYDKIKLMSAFFTISLCAIAQEHSPVNVSCYATVWVDTAAYTTNRDTVTKAFADSSFRVIQDNSFNGLRTSITVKFEDAWDKFDKVRYSGDGKLNKWFQTYHLQKIAEILKQKNLPTARRPEEKGPAIELNRPQSLGCQITDLTK